MSTEQDYITEIQRLRLGLEYISNPAIHLKNNAKLNGHNFDSAVASSIITVEHLKNKAKTILRDGEEYAKELC